MTTKPMAPEARRAAILAAALRVAKKQGFQQVTRRAVAAEAKISEALVSHYFGTATKLRRALMRAAVHTGNARIVAQGLAAGDPTARKASPELKQKALEFLANS